MPPPERTATTIQYEYDAESNLTKLTDVHGNVTRYEYYNDNRLYKVIVERPSQADRVFTYSYDLAGRLAQIEYPAETGIVARFDDGATPTPNPGWNANGQLTHLGYLKNGAHLHSFEYDYDDAGNRKTFIDTPQNTADAIEWRYSYDWLDRLVEVQRGDGGVTPTTARVYAYDESDNRTYVDFYDLNLSHRYVNDAADQIEKRQVGTFLSRNPVDYSDAETFTYDLDGNMTQRVLDPAGSPLTTSYHWSEFDGLIRVSTSTATTSNSYDVAGVRKRSAGSDGVGLKSFTSGLPTINEVEVDPTETSEVSYLMGHQLLGFERSDQFFYFVMDGLTSVRVVTSSAGAPVASYQHDEFGRRLAATEDPGRSSKTYVGGLSVHDEVPRTGLLYMRHRWQDPALGRFLSRDPIGYGGGLNHYNYVDQNPVNFVDPRGLDTTTSTMPPAPGPGAVDYNVHLFQQPNRDVVVGVTMMATPGLKAIGSLKVTVMGHRWGFPFVLDSRTFPVALGMPDTTFTREFNIGCEDLDLFSESFQVNLTDLNAITVRADVTLISPGDLDRFEPTILTPAPGKEYAARTHRIHGGIVDMNPIFRYPCGPAMPGGPYKPPGPHNN